MGTIPVFFTCQSPGEPDTNREILFNLMQIIAHDNKEKADHKAGPKSDIQVISQIIGVKENINAYGKHRDDPEDHFANAGIDIFPFGICQGYQGNKKLQDKQDQGKSKYPKELASPAISPIIVGKVYSKLLWQLIP